MASEWRQATLRDAGVQLIDCDHRTPAAAESGYPYIAIPQLKDGRIDLSGVRRISAEDFADWTRKLRPKANDVIVVRRCNSGVSAVVPEGLECAIGQNLVVLRADGKSIYPPYLRWLVRGAEWWSEVSTYINVGAVFDSLKCKDIPPFPGSGSLH
jgi:type I restriction enzyme S subunit